MSTYYELLKHPNWQRKRLEILARDGFRCDICETTETTLHVHHGYYEKGAKPWEYPEASLHTLCEKCHKDVEGLMAMIHRTIGTFSVTGIERLLGYAQGIKCGHDPDLVVQVHSFEHALGLGDPYGLDAPEVIAALEDGAIDGHKLFAMSKRWGNGG